MNFDDPGFAAGIVLAVILTALVAVVVRRLLGSGSGLGMLRRLLMVVVGVIYVAQSLAGSARGFEPLFPKSMCVFA